jgi:hypothetical protein
MKKILWTFLCVTLAGSLLGVDLKGKRTLTFSTKGPDRYADGTTQVYDNEKYALVYMTSTTNNFGGFYTDGTLVNTNQNQLLYIAAVASQGCCPEQIVEFDASLIKKGSGGRYVVVLLDTRAPDTATTQKLGDIVMGWSEPIQSIVAESNQGGPNTISSDTTVSSAKPPLLPPAVSAAPPVITGINVTGDKVIVSVENASPKAYYAISGTDDIKKDKGQWVKTEFGKHKKGDGAGKVELEYPVSSTGKFFQVVVPVTAN